MLFPPLPGAIDVGRAFSADALGIAITGMVIVFASLVVISGFIALLPRMLDAISGRLVSAEYASATPDPDAAFNDEEAIIAALGHILHTELQRQSD